MLKGFQGGASSEEAAKSNGGGGGVCASPSPSPVGDSCAGAAATSQKATEKQNP